MAALVVAGLLAALWFGWHRYPLLPRHPTAIVIHHTATPPRLRGKMVDVAVIDAMHARRGFRVTDADGAVYHIGYHYLIQQDGTVLPGRPEHLHGAHTKGYPHTLGIALVGNFEPGSNNGSEGPLSPPSAQLAAATALTRRLMTRYHISPHRVYLHRDLRPTACPGSGFPSREFYQAITQQSPQR